MIENEILTKGIILAVYPQGEFGKRISLLSDKFGKITIFSKGAAKQSSRSIGALRPLVCGSFSLLEGKGAKTLLSVKVLDSFEELPLDPEVCFYASYVLEFADYLSAEGMPEAEAKNMLNLIYLTLRALREHVLPKELIRRIFELRMLVSEGIYTEEPFVENKSLKEHWDRVLKGPLSGLMQPENWLEAIQIESGVTETGRDFIRSVRHLTDTQISHRFQSQELLDL